MAGQNKKRLYAFVGTWQTFGGKGDGIHVYRVNESDGTLTEYVRLKTALNTSMLCVTDKADRIYAVDERKDYNGLYGMGGGVVAIAFDEQAAQLKIINQRSSLGACPAFIAVDEEAQYVVVANHGTNPCAATTVCQDVDGTYYVKPVYDDASTVLFPLGEDGCLQKASDVRLHTQIGEKRPAHCHSVTFSPSGRWILACDKGHDRIYVYQIDRETKRLTSAAFSPFEVRHYASPRHLMFHPSKPMFFVSNEYEYSVSSYGLDEETGRIYELDTQSTDFDIFVSGRRNYPGTTDVRVHPNGYFVYVANRTTNNGITGYSAKPITADYENGTISLFGLDPKTGKLSLLERFMLTCGNPRAMTLTPDGRYLYVAELDRDALMCYPVNPKNGRIILQGRRVAAIPSPSCIRFHYI